MTITLKWEDGCVCLPKVSPLGRFYRLHTPGPHKDSAGTQGWRPTDQTWGSTWIKAMVWLNLTGLGVGWKPFLGWRNARIGQELCFLGRKTGLEIIYPWESEEGKGRGNSEGNLHQDKCLTGDSSQRALPSWDSAWNACLTCLHVYRLLYMLLSLFSG